MYEGECQDNRELTGRGTAAVLVIYWGAAEFESVVLSLALNGNIESARTCGPILSESASVSPAKRSQLPPVIIASHSQGSICIATILSFMVEKQSTMAFSLSESRNTTKCGTFMCKDLGNEPPIRQNVASGFVHGCPSGHSP